MNDTFEQLLKRADANAGMPAVRPADDIAAIARQSTTPTRHGLLMPSTLAAAAALLLVFGLAFLFSPSSYRTAGAAERLRTAAATTAGYRGWIRDEWGIVKNEKVEPTWWQQFNTVDGTNAYREIGADPERASIRLPAIGEAHEFRIKTNTIHRYDLAPGVAEYWKQYFSRDTGLLGILDSFRQETPQAVGMTSSRDGELEKFSLAIPADPPNYPAARQYDVWIDPASHLVQKIQFNGLSGTPDGPREMIVLVRNFTYGAAPINDIHGLGVPRDAKVVDERPNGEIKALLARVEGRISKGFGNYVATLATDDPDDRMYLYARSGDRFAKYGFDTQARDEKLKQSKWLDLGPADAIKALSATLPYSFDIESDAPGRGAAWTASLDNVDKRYHGYNDLADHYEHPDPLRFDVWMFGRISKSIEYRIWPSRERFGGFFHANGDAGIKYELLKDPARPGLIGLTVGWTVDKPSDRPDRGWTVWLDPQRDDIPVEVIERRAAYEPEHHLPTNRIEFLEYAQLLSGSWYPTKWRETSMLTALAGKPVRDARIYEYRLKIDPAAKLPDDWYTDPAPRLNAMLAK